MAPGCEHDWSEASLCPDSWCQTRQGLTSVNTVVRARWDQDGNGIQGLPWISDISSCHCGFRTIFSIFFPWLVWGQCGHCPVVVCLREVWEWVLREWRRWMRRRKMCYLCVLSKLEKWYGKWRKQVSSHCEITHCEFFIPAGPGSPEEHSCQHPATTFHRPSGHSGA